MAVESIAGTAFCDKNTWYATNNPNYGPSNINDGNPTTVWYGAANDPVGSLQNFVGVKFNGLRDITDVTVNISAWGRNFSIGTWNPSKDPASASFTKADIIPIYVHDVVTTPNDADGVVIGAGENLRFPAVASACPGILFYCDNSAASILSDRRPNYLPNWNLSFKEVVVRGGAAAVPAPPADPHPKPPASVPVLPYTAAPPAYWVKTEYSTPGDFSFTPEIDTTVVLVVAQGAGAGGRVTFDLAGNATPNNATLFGGDSFASNASGRIIVAPGGESTVLADAAQFPASMGTATNWLRTLDHAGQSGGITVTGDKVGQYGGQSTIAGTAGSTFTLYAQDLNSGFVAANPFNSATPPVVVPAIDGYVQDASYGFISNRTSIGATGSVSFTFKAVAGQVLTIGYGRYISSTFTGPATISVNNVVIKNDNTAYVGTRSVTYTVTETGPITVTHAYTRTTNSTAVTALRSINITGAFFGGASSGASGRAAALYMLPEPLTFTVGKGGVGQPGGQPVTAAQNGTRGSGGGVGGNGGDGVIAIYEWKGVPVYDKPPTPVFATYNIGLTLEVLAAYRTNYAGTYRGAGFANTQTAFTHKLRPRTKFVLALITGAGGDVINWGKSEQTLPTTITSGAITNVAESGWSGVGGVGGAGVGGVGGVGGVMQDAPNIVYGGKGTDGYASYYSGSNPNTSVISGGYGSGATATQQVNSGGGCGGYGLIAIPESQFSADRTITGLVANVGGAAVFGVVFLFEMESEYGPFISGLAEQILLKNTNAAIAITQTPEQILYKESESTNNLQVSHATIAFVVDADDPLTNVSSSVEQILLRDKAGGANVSSSVESILMRTGSLPWRITQTAQMILAAELPSVFWLNFGTLQYPMARTVYDSQVGRATSVQTGAYIQLESPHMDGTTLVVNGVAVGLSSPIQNNDSVFIRGGVTNYYQKEMNVYTYYTKNGQIARELVGQWKLLRADLTPTLSRKYSVPYTNASWIRTRTNFGIGNLIPWWSRTNFGIGNLIPWWSRTNFGIGNLVPLWTRATSKLGAMFSTMLASGHSALAGLTSMFTKALTTVFNGNGAVISQNNHDTFAGPDAEIAQVETIYAEGLQSIITKDREVLGEKVSGADASAPNVNAQTWDGYEQMIPGAEPVVMLDFEQSQAHTDQYETADFNGDTQVGFGEVAKEYDHNAVGFGKVAKEYDHNAVGFGQYTSIDYLTGTPVGFGKVAKEYDYNAVGKSYFAEQTYKAVYNSGSRQMFSMETLGTIAYSSLTGTSYSKNSGVGTGNWMMPLGLADWARNGFGLVSMVVMERAIAHPHLVDRAVERDGSKNLGYFDSSPVMHKVGFGNFEQSVVKSSVNSGTVERIVIHTQHYLALVNLTAYRPAEAISGRGKASLYMGFDTLQDVQDYTEQYAGVTTLAAYNGFVYNLAVDKSFVCEIYFNGAVSGLIQGG